MMKLVRTLLALSVSAVCAHAAVNAAAAPLDAAYGVTTDPLLHRSFVVDRAQAAVTILDLVHYVEQGVMAVDPAPGAILSNSANSRLYVAHDTAPGTVTVMNAETGDTIAKIAVGDHPLHMAADFPRGELYVVNNASGTVSVIDIATNDVLATIAVGNAPNGVAVDGVRRRVYVANAVDGTLSVIDQESRAVTATLDAGRNPGPPLVDLATGRVLVNNLDDATVTILDPAANGIVGVRPTGGEGSTTATISAAYRRYFLPNAASGSVTDLDLDALVVNSIPGVGGLPAQVAVDEHAGAVFVANRGDGTVSVIDPRDDHVKAVLAAGAGRASIDAGAPGDRLVVAGDATAQRKAAFVAKPRLIVDTAIAAEYYAPDADTFFHTTDAVEKRLLDDGIVGTAWQRTEGYWRVWTGPAAGRVAVCRFLGSGATYRYALGDECDALRQDPAWSYEKIAYFAAKPDASGRCADATQPLFRLADPALATTSFRYTTDTRARDAMLARGWLAQESGDTAVFACVPRVLDLRRPADDGVAPPAVSPPRLHVPLPPNVRPKAVAASQVLEARIAMPARLAHRPPTMRQF